MKKLTIILSLSLIGICSLSFSTTPDDYDDCTVATMEKAFSRILVGTVVNNTNGCYTFQTCGGSQLTFEDPNNVLPYPWPEAGYLFVSTSSTCFRKLADIEYGNYCL